MQRIDFKEKAIKTAAVLGAMNFICNPVAQYMFGSLGNIFILAENIFVLYLFHERGKTERPLSTLMTNGTTFFSSIVKQVAPSSSYVKEAESSERDNSLYNVVTGGAAFADELKAWVQSKR